MIRIFLLLLLIATPAFASGWYSTLQGTASDVEQSQIPDGASLQYNNSDKMWEFSYATTPAGGASGQVLTKNSSSNFDYSWTTPTGGGSQTPWTSNIDGGGYGLSNVSTLATNQTTFDDGQGHLTHQILANPPITQVGTVTNSGGTPWAIVKQGNIAYVNFQFGNNIDAIDETTPSNPILLGTYTDTCGQVENIITAGDFLILSCVVGGTYEIVNKSNPTNMVYAATITLPAGAPTNLMAAYGQNLYLATYYPTAYLYWYDLSPLLQSPPSAPALVSDIATNYSLSGAKQQGRYLYTVGEDDVNNFEGHLVVYDLVTTPNTFTQVGDYDTGYRFPYDLQVSGSSAYVIYYYDYVAEIINVSDPTMAAPATSVISVYNQFSNYDALLGRYWIVVDQNYIYIIDVLNPLAGSLITTLTLPDIYIGVASDGNYAYLTDLSSNNTQTWDLNGFEISTMNIGELTAGKITATNDIVTGGNILAGTSATVGYGGIMTTGNISGNNIKASGTAYAQDFGNNISDSVYFGKAPANNAGDWNFIYGDLNAFNGFQNGWDNVGIGRYVGQNMGYGWDNMLIGYYAGGALSAASSSSYPFGNTFLGNSAGSAYLGISSQNVSVGDFSTLNGTCTNTMTLGSWAGYYEGYGTCSNGQFLIDTINRGATDGNATNEPNNALMSGHFDSTVANQTLKINAVTTINSASTLTTGTGTLVYYCSAGVSAGQLCRGNGCSCVGGTETAIKLKV